MSFLLSGVNLSWEKGRNYMHYGYSIGMGNSHCGFSSPLSRENLTRAFEDLSKTGVKTIRVFFSVIFGPEYTLILKELHILMKRYMKTVSVFLKVPEIINLKLFRFCWTFI